MRTSSRLAAIGTLVGLVIAVAAIVFAWLANRTAKDGLDIAQTGLKRELSSGRPRTRPQTQGDAKVAGTYPPGQVLPRRYRASAARADLSPLEASPLVPAVDVQPAISFAGTGRVPGYPLRAHSVASAAT